MAEPHYSKYNRFILSSKVIMKAPSSWSYALKRSTSYLSPSIHSEPKQCRIDSKREAICILKCGHISKCSTELIREERNVIWKSSNITVKQPIWREHVSLLQTNQLWLQLLNVIGRNCSSTINSSPLQLNKECGDICHSTARITVIPVSYTHLDVYKRQMYGSTLFIIHSKLYYFKN